MLCDKISDRDLSQKAIDSLQALVFITNSVQVECEGYGMLGEYESCRECLEEFRRFILDNNLTQRDTLIMLNENSSQEKIEIVDEFIEIADRIRDFEECDYQIEGNILKLLAGEDSTDDEEAYNE